MGQLSTKDVINFAINLVTHDDGQPNEVWQIASLSDKDSDEIHQLVQNLADKEANSQAEEQRKWRAILLKQTLEELPQNYLNGLVLLTDFWENLVFQVMVLIGYKVGEMTSLLQSITLMKII